MAKKLLFIAIYRVLDCLYDETQKDALVVCQEFCKDAKPTKQTTTTNTPFIFYKEVFLQSVTAVMRYAYGGHFSIRLLL